MCGIVAYIGNKNATNHLLNGLKRLEYRGYDSAGICTLGKQNLHLCKEAGNVSKLVKAVQDQFDETLQEACQIGIAHTRWATHGKPTKINAHPHLDQSGQIALVHNGIIENFQSLKKHLEKKGYSFQSETDSEVLANLISEHFQGDLVQAVCDALSQVTGTFGLAVISNHEPNSIIVAKRGSPIVLGVSKNETLIASDASAIAAHTQRVIYLNDNDIAVITNDNIDIRDLNQVPVSREIAELDWSQETCEKGEFEHFMLKEIHDQPASLKNSIRGRLDFEKGSAVLGGLQSINPQKLAKIQRVIILGCGTSLHAGMLSQYAFEDLAGIPTHCYQSSDFRYRNPIIYPTDLIIAISQSGETADTLAAIREAKEHNALILSLCNVVGSTIARETGLGVYLHAGPEISVASTKAFSSQAIVLLMLSLKLARNRRFSQARGQKLCQTIAQIPHAISQVLSQDAQIAETAKKLSHFDNVFYIGRNHLHPIALEGALKLKEISYIHAEGCQASELKHGSIALLDEKFPVIALLNDLNTNEKMLGTVEECLARKAPIVGIIQTGDEQAKTVCTHTIEIPACDTFTAPLVANVVLQLLAYHIAKIRGCEIDQPRNLAKSVTVE